jgi:UDP-glucose:(heptosyl)LPS alpha-1,3-glucosyltransferase
MRLAIIRQDYSPEAPFERFLESALEALLERNVAVTLYTRSQAPTRLQLIEQSLCDPFHFGRAWRDIAFANAVCRRVVRARPDLVESHLPVLCCDIYRAENGLYATWFAEELDAATRARAVRLRASPRWRHLLRTEAAMLASPLLAAIICPSELVRDELRDRYGLPEARLAVIRTPVDIGFFVPELRAHRDAVLARHAIDPGAPVLLFASNDWQRDGARALIEALARAPAKLHLVLLGETSTASRYAQRARALGVEPRVTFAGLPADPERYLGAADAFALPARYDPRASAALNALSTGLPVIVSERSGAAELVRASGCGLVVPSREPAALDAALATIADAAARQQLAARARAAVMPFAPPAMTLKQVLLYRDLLAATVRNRDSRSRGAATPPAGSPPAPGQPD